MLRYILYSVISLVLLTGAKCNSSSGTPFLTNFIYPERSHNHIWSIDQSNNGTILIAKRTGLVEFDSEDWSPIETPDIPLKIATSDIDNKTYISGRNFAGYVINDSTGRYKFQALDSANGNHLYTEIIETDSNVYFYSSTMILEYVKHSDTTIARLLSDFNYIPLGIFSHQQKIFLNLTDFGIARISDSSFTILKTPKNLLNSEISFHCRFDDKHTLIGTPSGQLFLFNGRSFKPYTIDNDEFIKSGILTDGLIVDSNLIVLATENFGVIIADKLTGKTLTIANQDAGLPSNQVMTLMTDKTNGLWLAHTKGLTRIDTKLPVSNYNSYPGLDASVNAIYHWNDKLFLATSNGVATLDSISLYDTKEMVQRIPIKSIQPIAYKTEKPKEEIIIKETADSDPANKAKKGFLSRLFGKKKNEEAEKSSLPKTNIPEKKEVVKTPVTRYRQRYQTFKYETFVLKDKIYGFSNLSEITSRCKYFLPFKNQLLAISDAGIFSINTKKEVLKIFSSSNIFHVTPSKNDSSLIYIIAAEGIYLGSFVENEWKFNLQNPNDKNIKITSLIELTEKDFLLALNNQLVYYTVDNDIIRTIDIQNPYSEPIYLKTAGKHNYVIVGDDLYRISGIENNQISLLKQGIVSVIQPYLNQQNSFWIKGKEKIFKYFGHDSLSNISLAFLSVFENVTDIHIDNLQNIWVVDNYNSIFKINNKDFRNYETSSRIYIKSIETIKGKWLPLDNFELNYSENGITITLFSPSYIQYNTNQYQYYIKGLTNKWSAWSYDNQVHLPYIPAGKFDLMVKSRDILGNTSSVKVLSFKVLPPFWQTYYFYAGILTGIILISIILQRIRMKKLVKEKLVLSQKVKERTIELELKNKAITDSINYAGKMQGGLLPPEESIRTYVSDFFIFFQPRDIVSGDFYWAMQKNQYTVIAAADCTGHGVPGAFMSMLGMAYMSEIVGKAPISTASDILGTLRKRIIQLLSQKNAESRDGMDIALLLLDSKEKVVHFAGAHNPLYRIVSKKNELSDKDKDFLVKESNKHYLLHYKANRFHVGKSNHSDVEFTNHVINSNADDMFYLFSDGFADQFGGAEERKFMYGPFKQLILDMANKPMKEQKKILKNTMDKWMGDVEQTDDMLIFGIRS